MQANYNFFVMKVDGLDIVKYWVAMSNGSDILIMGLVKKRYVQKALSNFPSSRWYLFTADIFDSLRVLNTKSCSESKVAVTINIYAHQSSEETVRLNGQRFYRGLVEGFMKVSSQEHLKRLRG
jgi:UTP-glucose-1-phosphate uridylyltransferase